MRLALPKAVITLHQKRGEVGAGQESPTGFCFLPDVDKFLAVKAPEIKGIFCLRFLMN